jgi:Sulfatase
MSDDAFGGTIGTTVAASTAWWPSPPTPPAGRTNVLMVVLDDVGFADFGCYGSEIDTPTIDRLADEGVRYTGFHTTAMCSTTRAALLTGRNHHSVGMGCLANFDSGFPGYRGKIAGDIPTIPPKRGPPGRSTGGRSAADSTATTASSMPRPTNSHPNSSVTTPM